MNRLPIANASKTAASPVARRRLKVAIVGGPDVGLRLELVQRLGQEFDLYVLGSDRRTGLTFEPVGADYRFYPMTRGISPWRDMVTLVALARQFRSIHPDIVHTYDTKPCVLGRLSAWAARVPVIIGTNPGMGSLYATDALRTRLLRRLYELIQRLACKVSDLNILQNVEDLEDFVSRRIMARSKTTIVHGSGVNTETFKPARLSSDNAASVRSSLGLSDDAIVITMVSRIMRTKGVLEYATAANAIRHRFVDLQFLLVGSADHESPDRLAPKEIEFLRRSVQCLGRRDDVADILSVTDIFVLPSFSMEGVPRSLLEAAASGLAIVTTNTRGCKDVIRDGISGILIRPKDPEALETAILSLARNPEQRTSLGREARRRAVQEFDLGMISNRITKIYKDLTQRNGRLPP